MAGQFVPIPDWFSQNDQDCGIAVADLTGQGVLDIVVLEVDDPAGQNSGNYRVGHALAADGRVGSWGPWLPVPDWWGWENQGAGLIVADLDGDGRPELIVFTVDHPRNGNGGLYTIGWGLDGTGHCVDGWSRVPEWGFDANQGAAIALLPGVGALPRLVVSTIDHPAGGNTGYYPRVLDLDIDLATAATEGAWRILDFDTEVNPVHAALLHTGDILFFAGSGNDPDRLGAHDFRTRVWHYPDPGLDAPTTPIDLFCSPHPAGTSWSWWTPAVSPRPDSGCDWGWASPHRCSRCEWSPISAGDTSPALPWSHDRGVSAPARQT
ncbi:hypothetical protein KHQ06_28320 [Nocardia tengchongensis]|uniref:VCBS repeat protein n=1 Tax=Nocardia tengchongensis TaxID=2055889 RepID=A0ABX8CPJ0_9NOCA|nr:VCBS repeat-containing protein [Nocardia tengchongensis]QVI20125.1 hypothetical protein KHQ06_28320 [Nocardia tengchongensis]